MFPWCLVAFQKIFWKIFSGVWKRRRKTQIQKNTSHNPNRVVRRLRRRSQSKIAIDGAIVISPSSQDHNCKIAIDGAISRSVDGNLDPVRSHEGEIAIFARSRRRQSRFGAILRRRDRNLNPVRSRSRSSREIAINGAIS